MINKPKLAFIGALVTISIASPAFAVSLNGTGSSLPSYYNDDGGRVWGVWSPPQEPAVRNRSVAQTGRHLHTDVSGGVNVAGPLSKRTGSASPLRHRV